MGSFFLLSFLSSPFFFSVRKKKRRAEEEAVLLLQWQLEIELVEAMKVLSRGLVLWYSRYFHAFSSERQLSRGRRS